MPLRYTDLDLAASGARDFVIRKRTPSMSQLFSIFTTALLCSLVIILMVGDKALLAGIFVFLLGALGWYIMLQTQRNRDLLLATEFQNALFASALGLNNKFCLIIKRDGNIIYIDRSFQDMFPDFLKQPRRTIDILLDQGQVSRSDSEKIFSSIERGVYEKVIFDIRAKGNEFHRLVMSIEPIMRPSGFILLRGREFVETRVSNGKEAKAPEPLSKSSITLFSHVMDTMNMGVYMSGPSGNLVYVNPVLERWLDFNEGEIASKTLSLQDIIHQDGKKSDTIEPDNYEGEIMLQKKSGGLMRSFINQKVIRDDQGKIVGCTALVHNFAEKNPDVKKKLW